MLFSIPFDCSYYDTIILVHGGLGDAKLLCGAAYRGLVFDDEHCQIAGALLDICIQMHHSPLFPYSMYMSGSGGI